MVLTDLAVICGPVFGYEYEKKFPRTNNRRLALRDAVPVMGVGTWCQNMEHYMMEKPLRFATEALGLSIYNIASFVLAEKIYQTIF